MNQKVKDAIDSAVRRGSLNPSVCLPIEEAGDSLRPEALPDGVRLEYSQSLLVDNAWHVRADLRISEDYERALRHELAEDCAPDTERSP